MSRFDDFDLDPRIQAAVQALGFTSPTPIQTAAIPPLLGGKDVIGGARTGSGKTAAFGLPLLQRTLVNGSGAVRALVLTPTRELALQVTEALRSYAENIPVRMVAIYGGASYRPQFRALKAGVPVVVGTPGRVIDHLDKGSLRLDALETLVLDEADEMLRMGFIEDVEKVIEASPQGRQICLFSATMPDAIRRIARKHQSDAAEIQVEDDALTTEHINQRWIRTPHRHKLEALVRILQAEDDLGASLVFARTRQRCADLADALESKGIAAEAFHGDLNQNQREQVVRRLRSGRIQTVVATDVAARGIDVERITHVINVDLPTDAEVYVHRIGRTGRAGRDGNAVTLVTPSEVRKLRYIERATSHRIEQVEAPSDALIAARRRRRLRKELAETLADTPAPGAQRLVDDLLDVLVESDDSIGEREIATAALRLLARVRGLDLTDEPDAQAPYWSSLKARGNRERKRSSGRRKSGRKSGRRSSGRREHHGDDPTQEAALFLPAGRSRGVRPRDIVGLLTNGCGLSSSVIGRITILENKTFVGLPDDVLTEMLKRYDSLQVRGRPVNIARAFERDGSNQNRASGRRQGGSGRKNQKRSGRKHVKKRWNRNR